MKTARNTDFLHKDGTINTAKAIEAGHDARTAAIIYIAHLISSAIKAAFNRVEPQIL